MYFLSLVTSFDIPPKSFWDNLKEFRIETRRNKKTKQAILSDIGVTWTQNGIVARGITESDSRTTFLKTWPDACHVPTTLWKIWSISSVNSYVHPPSPTVGINLCYHWKRQSLFQIKDKARVFFFFLVKLLLGIDSHRVGVVPGHDRSRAIHGRAQPW